ncbi:hypothetical protein J6590_046285 [Homalodisca vitripennis]|nr:hypothetical protein J6590_046285 [Homalodisca vitripennis]
MRVPPAISAGFGSPPDVDERKTSLEIVPIRIGVGGCIKAVSSHDGRGVDRRRVDADVLRSRAKCHSTLFQIHETWVMDYKAWSRCEAVPLSNGIVARRTGLHYLKSPEEISAYYLQNFGTFWFKSVYQLLRVSVDALGTYLARSKTPT